LTLPFNDFTLRAKDFNMRRVFFLCIFGWSVGFLMAEATSFQGRVELTQTVASLQESTPRAGTLYLVTGSASNIEILSEEPFKAKLDLVESFWDSDASLNAHQITVYFEGDAWADIVQAKRPRRGAETVIYPYRKFQAALVYSDNVFRAIAVPVLF
jgi:hypothetical protein